MAAVTVLVVAVTGVGAASAQAEPLFKADGYTATVSGAPLGSTIFRFHLGASPLTWECLDAQLQGELPTPSPALALAPTYSECRWQFPPGSSFSAVTMVMNGCKWRLHALSKVETGAYQSQADLECPSGQEALIELRQLTVTICRMRLPSQTGKSQILLLDRPNEAEEADDSIEAFFSVEKLRYKMEALSFACPVGTGTFEDLTYKGEESFTAKLKSGGAPVGLRLDG
jgi:hypothetical protein